MTFTKGVISLLVRIRYFYTVDLNLSVVQGDLDSEAIARLSKLRNLCTHKFSASLQKVGEIRMSQLVSPVLSFEIQAESMLKPCAEGKNMANSA